MKVYQLKREQHLAVSLEKAWDFFSSPENLSLLVPHELKFEILFRSGGNKMYSGQTIHYKLTFFGFIRIHWTTEITNIIERIYFVDDQRLGPFALWNHTHVFQPVEGGVRMTDEVNYALPLGYLGRLAHTLFVGRMVKRIFDYRFKVLESHFKGQ